MAWRSRGCIGSTLSLSLHCINQCHLFLGMTLGVLVMVSLCETNADTAASHDTPLQDTNHHTTLKESARNRMQYSTFQDGITHEEDTIKTIENSGNIEKGLDTYVSYDNTSRPTTAPYNENQTMTQNHDLHAFEEIIAFDVCEPCRGASKYIIVIY